MKAESFGYKNAWLAGKGVTPAALAEALALRNVRGCNWTSGLAAAYEEPIACAVFVTPPIDGWVLCVGSPLFALADARPPEFGPRVAELAKRLQTEVQYFSTHRVVEAHAWARARPDRLVRAYAFVGESGEKVEDVGGQTSEEKSLGFSFFDPTSSDAASDGYWERTDLQYVGEQHVMGLAAKWSVDPSALTDRDLEVGDGLLGDFGSPPPAEPPTPILSSRPWWKVW